MLSRGVTNSPRAGKFCEFHRKILATES